MGTFTGKEGSKTAIKFQVQSECKRGTGGTSEDCSFKERAHEANEISGRKLSFYAVGEESVSQGEVENMS